MIRSIFSTYRNAYAGLPRPVWVLAATLFINRSGNMVLPFLALYMSQELGATAGQVSLAIACQGIGALCGANLGGWLCRHLSYHRIQVASMALAGVGFMVLSRFRDPYAIAAIYLLISTVNESFRPANGAAVTTSCGREDRARAMALVRMAVNLGMTVSPIIGGYLATIDYVWIFVFDGVTCLAAALFLLLAPYPKHERAAPLPPGERRRSPWRDRRFLIVMALAFPTAMIFFQLFSTWPIYLKRDLGMTEIDYGLLMTISTLLIVAFEMILAHRLRQAATIRVIAVGALLTGLGVGWSGIAGGFAALAIGVVIWAFGEMLFVPFLSGFAANQGDDNNRGAYMGILTLLFAFGWILGPATGLQVMDHFGGQALWFGCAGVAMLQFPLLWRLSHLDRPAAQEQDG